MRSKCEASGGTCPAAPAGLYRLQRLLGSHPSPISLGSSKEKAFSKGVVFEKEGNHLSLCIIACSRNISLPGSNCSQCADRDPACGGGCWGCSLQGAGFQELTEAADRHASSPQHCHLLGRSSHLPLSYRRPLCLSSPRLSKAIPSIQEGQGTNQISLPVCSTEKHIIFLCCDRDVFLIYHPLLCFGLLLKSVLFLFKNVFALFLTMFFQQS